MPREIPLARGLIAIVDDDDFERVSGKKWYAVRGGRTWYAASGKRCKCRMHRLILDAPAGVIVDHRNGNGLDNRRDNIRLCTQSENQRNAGKTSAPRHSRFKGVSWGKSQGWVAYIKVAKARQIHLGCFATEELAARAYDKAAKTAFGEFARLNFPEVSL